MAERVDRLSALPESLLHHVMSFLPLKQIIQVSSLSQTLLTAWKTIPDLEFDVVDLIPDFYIGTKEERGERERLYNYLVQILKIRLKERTYIRKFTLNINTKMFVHQIDRWISYAIKSNVKELELFLYKYNLPEIICCAKSLNVLDLRGCNLVSKRMSNVKLSSLRKLFLFSVGADDKVIHNLIVGCPLIEHLCMQYCNGVKKLELYGLSKLKEIMLECNTALQHVGITGSDVQSVTICCPWDSISCEIDITCCENLKYLNLCRVLVLDDWLCNQISSLSGLEYLRIVSCKKLHRIIISSPRLKALVVATCDNLIEVNIETPSLHIFKYVGALRRILFSSSVLDLSEAEICYPYKFYYSVPKSFDFQRIEPLEIPKDYCHGRVRLRYGKIPQEEIYVKKTSCPLMDEWLVYFQISQINNHSSI